MQEITQGKGRAVDPSATVIYEPQPKNRPRFDDGEVRCIQLEVIGGPMDGLTRRVNKAIMTIGRAEGNDLSLPNDPMVSGTHARIVREVDHFWLEDLGSRNGTYFGDERLRTRSLVAPGATFVVGRTSVEFTPR